MLKRRSLHDTSGGDEFDPQQIFHSFVNRLALICQIEPNGDAVSSCVVTQEPDKIVYVFASNYRAEKQLEDVAQALKGILEMVPPLDESREEPSAEARDEVLRAVLALNWSRVWRYLKYLRQEAKDCIASCERRGTERGTFPGFLFTPCILTNHLLVNQIGDSAWRWVKSHHWPPLLLRGQKM